MPEKNSKIKKDRETSAKENAIEFRNIDRKKALYLSEPDQC